MFLKEPLAPIYSNFEGEARAKKRQFFGQNFPKYAQKLLFWLFFFELACGATSVAKIGSFSCFESAQKISLVDLKKRVDKFIDFFLKIRLQ